MEPRGNSKPATEGRCRQCSKVGFVKLMPVIDEMVPPVLDPHVGDRIPVVFG